MLKKTIEFEDLDGNLLTEDFYFNLTKAELTEMHLTKEGGFYTYLKTVIESEDGQQILEVFKKILRASIGLRSEDGRRFVKSEKISDEFMQTNAYDVLFMQLVTDSQAAADFVNGIMPADLIAEIEKSGEFPPDWPTRKDENQGKPAYILEDREPTKEELKAMGSNELRELMMNRLPEAEEKPDALEDPKVPNYIREDREPTKTELIQMSPDEIQQAFLWRKNKKS